MCGVHVFLCWCLRVCVCVCVQVRLPLGVVPTITAEAAVAQVRAAVGRQFVLLEPDATARAIAIAFTSFQIECVLCARSLQTLFKCQKLF